ncbi:predicted protein [Phaeodactylum tricornutum CCAP 1055/1]|jgi:hypothetical protein|uniref:AMP-dependent synthetase/ligase domain-containing protein n=3 Tax=Phaeodactylum tricornutum TaxID=2850 RepID=B7G0K8_PHATC|nr:predicted protein [Phaeodactylum tricornutum CCAP 1055/1]EEC47901.1 predicted protein [Phaeodactylum tricornutum CCAP 1055/1]|eukprot:XP_002180493.1 predicted protein [Phaeodactylum tricornutum CCAP 1055/1]
MFVKPLLSRASSRAATLAARSSRALAPTTRLASRSLSTAVGAQLQALTTEYPHLDVVRYEHKNRVWSLQHVQYYSDALAIGLMENNLQPGDVVLSWLPEHFSEQMVLQFACAKSGLVLYTLDPMLATTDREKAKEALAKALEITKANVLVSQEAGNDVNYISLGHSVIPELRIFDFSLGIPFITPRFPHLRFPIHTGFDQDDKEGWLPLRHMVVPSGNLETFVDPAKISKDTPLAGELLIGADGVPTGVGKTLSNEQVVKNKIWPTFAKVLAKEYHEIKGVGVVF